MKTAARFSAVGTSGLPYPVRPVPRLGGLGGEKWILAPEPWFLTPTKCPNPPPSQLLGSRWKPCISWKACPQHSARFLKPHSTVDDSSFIYPRNGKPAASWPSFAISLSPRHDVSRVSSMTPKTVTPNGLFVRPNLEARVYYHAVIIGKTGCLDIKIFRVLQSLKYTDPPGS